MAHILVASIHPAKSASLVRLLCASGHDASYAADFHAAVAALDRRRPDLLVVDLRFGDFNGLHLASRCQDLDPSTHALVLDTSEDRISREQARRFRATYAIEPISDAELLAHVARAAVVAAGPSRRWPRKRPAAALTAQVAHRAAHLVELSYGGFRIEIPGAHELSPPRFEVALPSFGVAVPAKAVWTRAIPSGSLCCGAAIAGTTIHNASVWRHVVDMVTAS